ncbi:MAG: desulfoferrodoxin [Methanomassiliicoccaceae archaeon]|jgi:superoxide reductase|nr:desulfoferrodoxin [Methanomassiliicoccaceae archaeon]
MPKQREIYLCALCGNVVEVEFGGKGKLVCCGQDMALKAPNTTDAAVEKHVPVIEKKDGGILVKVGSATHPMADDHFIVYIEICDEGIVRRKYLKPGMPPEAFFKGASEKAVAKEYCNKHGLWKSS